MAEIQTSLTLMSSATQRDSTKKALLDFCQGHDLECLPTEAKTPTYSIFVFQIRGDEANVELLAKFMKTWMEEV